MTRVVVFSDIHPNKYTAGFPRYDDVAKTLGAVRDHVINTRPDVAVCLGDLCEPTDSQLLRCIQLAQWMANEFREAGIPSVWIAGNHDVLEDGHGTTSLDPLMFMPKTEVFATPGWCPIGKPGSSDVLVALPYPSASKPFDVLECARHMATKEIPSNATVRMVASHLMLEGIAPGSETEDMARGRDVFLPLDELVALFPRAVFTNGHYHSAQVYRDRVHIPGAVARFTRGEAGNHPRLLDFSW